ncbi:MAG: molybdopterin-dependent oxidoreductase [Acidobacteria bacterium]|nr:molybdopterin-dependent oxidoreductase [Acidobacteriota bacterium]
MTLMMLRIAGPAGPLAILGFEDLARLPGQLSDVSERFPGRQGRGVPLASVLSALPETVKAARLKLSSADGFSITVEVAEAEEAVLVYALGEGPLPTEQGGPIRFFLHDAEACRGHGDEPCANVKALGSIELEL